MIFNQTNNNAGNVNNFGGPFKMLRFKMVSGGEVNIDPRTVAAVQESEVKTFSKSLLSGNGPEVHNIAEIIMGSGIKYAVFDPDRGTEKGVAMSIEIAKRNLS